jgi:4-hydroxybenzoate polyprenyltransferase
MGLAVIGAMLPGANPLALVLALAGPWVFGWHMTWQLRRLELEDNDRLLMLFRSNRDAGLLVLPFFAAALLV